MKVWVVFSGIEDFDGPYFETVCDSLETANAFIEQKVTVEVRRWHWMEKRYQESNIAKRIKDYRADETEILQAPLEGRPIVGDFDCGLSGVDHSATTDSN